VNQKNTQRNTQRNINIQNISKIETPTLDVKEYRGHKIYIRRLGGEVFEYLVVFGKEIFCNQVEIRKEVGSRMRNYTDEELTSAVALMLHTAQLFLDDKIWEKIWHDSPGERWKRLKQKVADKIFSIKYKLSDSLLKK